MSDTSSDRWESPIFVASLGRSGSTLLQRVLNVHPQVTIWGEHGGMLKGITEACTALQHEANTKNLESGRELRDSVVGELTDKENFYPWVSPFTTSDVVGAFRATLLDLFTRGLSPEIRWGFKEIRYDEAVLRALMSLFPKAHLVMLARDLEGHVSSRFFAFGNRDYDFDSDEGRADAKKKVENMTEGWLRRYEGMLKIAEEMPERCSYVAYSDLVNGSERIPALFRELGESVPDAASISEVLQAKAGSSFRHNSIARSNRARLPEIFETAEFDRSRHAVIASAFGLPS